MTKWPKTAATYLKDAPGILADIEEKLLTLNEISTKHRIGVKTIRGWILQCGWPQPLKRKHPINSPEVVTKALGMYMQGITLEEIGEAVGVHRSQIGHWSRRFNWLKRNLQASPKGAPAVFADIREQLLTINQISDKHRIEQKTIRIWIRKFGWPKPFKQGYPMNSPEVVEKARVMFVGGIPLQEIAESVGLTETRIGVWARRFNWPPRTAKKRKESLNK